MNKPGHCYYPNEEHEMDKPSGCCCYWDEARGIEALQICNDHYNQHILKYFPDSRMAEHLRSQGIKIEVSENTTNTSQQQMRLF
jgi:hypothetical protein